MDCKACKKPIPGNAVQIGGYHMNCAEEDIVVFKIRPEKGFSWIVGEGHEWIKYHLQEMSPDDMNTLEIECATMTRNEIDNLPDHGGW